MTMETEEGANFLTAFKDTFGSKERTNARSKRERRAGMTPKQRARVKGPPKTQKNFRATAQTLARLKALLAAGIRENETDIIELAIEDLAKKHKVEGE